MAAADHMMETAVVVARLLQNDSELKDLNLSGQKMSDLDISHICGALCKNVWLRTIDMSKNDLTDLSALFVADMLLTNASLTSLNLSHNKFTKDGALTLTRAVQHRNTSVISVDLTGNQIPADVIRDLQYWLDLNRYPNTFKSTVPLIANNDKVETLNLSEDFAGSKHYTVESAQMLVSAIQKSQYLRIVRLDNNFRGDDLICAVLPAFHAHPTVTTISLSHNRIGLDGANAIAELLKKNDTITEIDLTDNELGDVGMRAILSALKVNDSCRKLLVQGNGLAEPLLQQLENALCLNKQPRPLKDLMPKLVGNEVGTESLDLRGPVPSNVRTPLVTSTTTTTVVDPAYPAPEWRSYDNLSAILLADVLRRNSAVTEIDLSNNEIGPDGAKALAEMLANNQTLTSLNLHKNHVQDEGAKALVMALEPNDYIVNLVLTENGLSQKMTVAVEKAITLNRQPVALKKLLPYLVENVDVEPEINFVRWADDAEKSTNPFRLRRLDDSSAELLSKALRDNAHITILNLNRQSITDVGVSYVAEMLKYNRSITSVSVLHNPKVSDDGIRALLSALRVNSVLTEVAVGEQNKTTAQWRGELERAVRLNKYPAPLKEAIPKIMDDDSSIKMIKFNDAKRDGPITDSACALLMDALKINTNVTSVDLSNNAIANGGADAIAQFLENSNWLWYLDLSHNDISAEGGMAIAKALRENSALKQLNLAHNHLYEDGAQAFEKMLVTNYSLKKLDLSDNFVSKPLMTSIAVRIALNNQPNEIKQALLGALNNDRRIFEIVFTAESAVSYHGVLPEDVPDLVVQDSLMEPLVYCLSKNTFVEAIDFSNGHLTDAGCRRFAELLHKNATIKSIKLCKNRITDNGVAGVLEELQLNNHTLLEFNVMDNPNVTAETRAKLRLAVALNTQPKALKPLCYRLQHGDMSLKSLRLCDFDGARYYDDVSCEILAFYLTHYETNVQQINLSNNMITDVGAQHLAFLLSVSKTVNSLKLDNNHITDEGVLSLARAVGSSPAITSVTVDRNDVNDNSVVQILEARLKDAVKRHTTAPAALVPRSGKKMGYALHTNFDEIKKADAMILNEALAMTHLGW